MRTVRVKTSQNVEITYALASLGLRLLAYIIDFFIVYFSVFVLFISVASMQMMSSMMVVFVLSGMLLASFYHLLMETLNNGRSIGKMIMNLQVIRADGEKPSLGDYLMRWIFRLVDITITSGAAAIISISVTDKRQRLGDVFADTVVIDTHKRPQPSIMNPVSKKPAPGKTETDDNDEKQPDAPKEAMFPEAALLSESDLRKIDMLYRKVKEPGYPPELRGKTFVRMKSILEKKMGIPKADMRPEEFMKQVYADFQLLQEQQEGEEFF